MSHKQVIQVPGLKTIGPYSHAVRAAGLLFVSGQPGVDPSTGDAVGASFDLQARQAFKNLDTVLRASGSRLDLVVNTVTVQTPLPHVALDKSQGLSHAMVDDYEDLPRNCWKSECPPVSGVFIGTEPRCKES